MNVLMTCGRFYPSVALVRSLHAAGARIDAADPYKLAPALHSHAVDKSHVVAAPAHEPRRFVEEVAKIAEDRGIDLIVPSFEEGFFLSRYAEAIPAPIFAPSFAAIAELHDKARFTHLCAALGFPTPKTVVADTQEALRDAVDRFASIDFVARPAYSRGGQTYFTNHGPRAGEITIDECRPTPDNPWLLQEFVEGHDACSMSIVRDGRIAVHCVYQPTVAAIGGSAVQFETIEDFGTLEIASKVAARFAYTGFLCFDYRRTPDGFVMIECNPRATAGCFLVPEGWIGEAVLGGAEDLRIADAGVRRQYDAYLLIGHSTRLKGRALIHELLSTPDAIASAHDILPALYCLINRRHFSHAAEEGQQDLVSAFTGDVAWDGSPMPELAA
jgi:glutathione synthase/RimK-type ligase-like ATP-grasp enzyme